jgi:hypothetical protein
MCTSFALLDKNEKKVLFLHNRDLPKEGFLGHEFKIFRNKSNGNLVFSIFDLRSKGIPCGFEANNRMYGGVANVIGYEGKNSRGVLLLNVLLNCEKLVNAVELMKEELKKGSYSSAKYILGNDQEIFLIENYAEEVFIKEINDYVTMTNHFEYIKKGLHNEVSLKRKKFVDSYIESKKNITLEDAIKIASTHEPVEICRHGVTLSSIILEISEYVRLLYTLSYPHLGYNEIKIENI